MSRRAIAFTHVLVSRESLQDRDATKQFISNLVEMLTAYCMCPTVRLLYLYISRAVEATVNRANDTTSWHSIEWEVLEHESRVRSAVARAIDIVTSRTPYQPEIVCVGLQETMLLLDRLQKINPKLVSNLAGCNGKFTYDCPKSIEAVIRIARGMNLLTADDPILRFDADVIPNDNAVACLVAEHDALIAADERCWIFSAGYCGAESDDVRNTYAVRTHFIPEKHFARQFLSDLAVIGAPQVLPGPAKSEAANNVLRRRGHAPDLRSEPQPISGAGLNLSLFAIRRLPPFSNVQHQIVWIDDWLKRLCHEVIGDLPKRAVQRVSGAEMLQDRYPNGIKPTDLQWAKEVYFERLLRGCLMQACIVDANGLPGPLADCLHETVVSLDLKPLTRRERIRLNKRLRVASMERFHDVISIWGEADYGTPVLHDWVRCLPSDYSNWVCETTAHDALAYVDLAKDWHLYRDTIELLEPDDVSWLFARLANTYPNEKTAVDAKNTTLVERASF